MTIPDYGSYDGLRQLLHRLRQATGPDHELDREIWYEIGGGTRPETGRMHPYAPSYTSSFETAYALLRDRLPTCSGSVFLPASNASPWRFTMQTTLGGPSYSLLADTPAIIVLRVLVSAMLGVRLQAEMDRAWRRRWTMSLLGPN